MSIVSYSNRPAPLAWDVALAIFGPGTLGAIHDASALERIFADTAGTTPITAGTPVALGLDARGEMGPNLLPQASFSESTTGWSTQSRWSFVDGAAVSSGGTSLVSPFTPVAGRFYEISISCERTSEGGDLSIRAGTSSPQEAIRITDAGTYIISFPEVADRFRFLARDWTGRITGVSIREVIGHTIPQPVTAQRPRLVRWPRTGRRNLMINTEDMTASGWTAARVNVEGGFPAPDGSMTAFKVTENSDLASHLLLFVSGSISVHYRISVYVKAAGRSIFMLERGYNNVNNSTAQFDLNTGEVISIGSGVEPVTIESVGDGWYRVSIRINQANNSLRCGFVLLDEPKATNSYQPYQGDGVSGVYLWHPQIEYESIAPLEPTPYQRVGNAYDITEEGVEDVWFFQKDDDGTDNLTINLDPGEYTKIAVNSKNEMFTDVDYVVSGPENILRDDGLAKSIYYQPDEPLTVGVDVAWPQGELKVSDFTSNPGFELIDEGDTIRITRTSEPYTGALILDTKPIEVGLNKVEFSITEISSEARAFFGATNGGAATAISNSYPSQPTNFSSVLNLTGAGNGRLRLLFSLSRSANPSNALAGDWFRLNKRISVRPVSYTLPLPVFDVLRRQYEPEPVVKLLGDEPTGLALDFVTGKAYMRGGGKDQLPRDINGFLNYASPSTKYVMSKDGVLVPGTTLRCDHDAQGNPLGLLIEGQRTNYLQQSDDVFSSPWVRALGNGVLEPVIDSRFGVMAKFTSTEESNLENVYNTPTSLPSPTEHVCYSMVMRILPGNSHTLQFRDRSSGGIGSTINLETGEITAYNTVNSNPVTVGRIDLGDGYYRYWWSCLAADLASFNLRHVSSSVGEQFIFGKCQIENGTFPTSYIKTEDSQVTRAGDNVSLATEMFPFDPDRGTMIVEGAIPTTDTVVTGGYYRTFASLMKTASTRFMFNIVGSNAAGIYRPGTNSELGGAFSGKENTHVKWSGRYSPDDVRFAFEGTLTTPTTPTGNLDGVTNLWVGTGVGSNGSLFGHVKSLVYIPRPLSDEELIARTTL